MISETPPVMPSMNWADKIPRMFYYTKWLLGEISPFIMIAAAIALAFAVLAIIVNLFVRRDDDEDDDDDDAYEYHSYR